jgi:2-dehydro-3-deoxygalactonokinase
VIAIDWGTSAFRAYRLDRGGKILDSRTAPKGILAVPPGTFPEVLEGQIGDWLDEAPVVMSGMVGSRQGWVEAPYVPCPAGLDEIAGATREVRKGVWIVPGVSCRDASGVHDVMRGEEVQVLGAGQDGLICLPGTHSKWVEVNKGRIERFSTCMTGELYAVLKQHSILGRMMEAGKPDARAFREGIERSGEPGGLLHHLFGVRTRGLMGELDPAASASYLSGLLIGHELRAYRVKKVYLLGAPELAALYARAAEALGIETGTIDPTAGTRALFRLGVMLEGKEAS